ncbi:REP element-mobilizing transposase RayT [Anaerobacterium chartisolvens]|uniref:REP element-mobilizing transposase RayT n=1 Tax=Anaerobacterium chartisolvens TaxID=1297424 RepID=A0A369AT01_9FIRM|nr:transposase [Anaerobacterium chartisolvens]RCX11357.1 REP element-mobilizing transposase RayT [Anaerobacterium chartisolvens]
MPRAARKKSEECMYHVMSRSISEIDLFQCDEDKDYYLALLKRYKDKYCCKIYAYALMDNHVHIYIDPCGYDISLFMRCLNNAYVAYFNRKYSRHGHLYQGRFASSIVDSDTYSLTLSAYIHNNAKDLPEYAGREELYRYSSYGIYTGLRKDLEEIVDVSFILAHFGRDKKAAREKYRAFTESMRDTGIMKEVDDSIIRAYTENVYSSEKCYIVRDRTPEDIMRKVGRFLGERLEESLRRKHSRETSSNRAFVTYIMRVLCGYTYKSICKYIGNMSVGGVSRLSNEGFKLLKENMRYNNAFNSLIQMG